ncbi:glycosyltransferase family 4 protein [Nonomuraea indica]|uniref:Glycosyltransferase family 4 protein n=1 Tax=Nonomuraea indica TaxID=1581193 RepID=A0ABW8A6K5_9ACTN
MRVAFVLSTTSGGTGRHVRMLTEGLVRLGHQVLVVGPRSVEERFAFTGAGARFAHVPVSDRPHPLNDAQAVLAVRRLTGDADVVHAHGLRAGALAALAAVGRGTRTRGRAPLVVTLHNALTAGGAVGFVYGVLERIVARRADRVLVVSPDLGERMERLGAGDVRPAVVPAPRLRSPRRTPGEVRAELRAGERPLVLTLARLAQQKGLENLLDAARGPWAGDGEETAGAGPATVPPPASRGDEHPGAAPETRGARDIGTGVEPRGNREATPGLAVRGRPLFLVAGEGPLREALQRRIDAEELPVVLLGERDDVPDLLAAATVVVWTSRWEGQPLSLSEALMAGRPVIATAVGGIPDLLAGAGRLVPYGDAGALRSAVRELVEDPEAVARMAEAAARRGAELPDADDAVAHVLDVYGKPRSYGR